MGSQWDEFGRLSCSEPIRWRVALKRVDAGQHFISHDSQRPKIPEGGRFSAAPLLGRHVAKRAQSPHREQYLLSAAEG